MKRFCAIATGGFIREIQRTFVEEGSEDEIRRGDQTTETTEFQQISSGFQVAADEVDTLTPEGVLAKIDAAAMEMRTEMERMMFQAVDRAVEQTGNVVSGKEGVTPETIMEVTEKIELDFMDGKPRLPQMVLAPHLIEKAVESIHILETDPEYKKRMEEIIERKRNEWAAREANYKLVG